MSKIRILLLGGIVGLLVLGLAATGFAFSWSTAEVKKEAGAVKLARETLRGGYRLVTTAELKQWIDEKKELLIIDTMPYDASYRKNHVPGAKQFLFPIPELEKMDKEEQAKFKKLLGKDKNRIIVIYCGFVKCTRSHNGALWARKLGYQNVYRYPGGIKAWMQAGYPVDKVK